MRPPLTRAFLPSCPPADLELPCQQPTATVLSNASCRRSFQLFIGCVSQLSDRQTEGARVVGTGQSEPSRARPSMNAPTPPPPAELPDPT